MISQGSDSRTSRSPGVRPEALFATLRGHVDALPTSFHVALDTLDARRLRTDPNLVSMPGFLLLDTGQYEPVLGFAPLALFWRMQGMDILAHTRAANRQRRAGPRALTISGSVWLVDGALDPGEPEPTAGAAGAPAGPPPRPPSLWITALHALDRVTIEPGGPRHIESIDTRTMLPRFTSPT